MRIVYGKELIALRKQIFEEVEQKRKEQLFHRAFVIVPQGRTLTLEQQYLEQLENGALMRAELLSFARFRLRLQESFGFLPAPRLSAQGEALLIRELILEDKASFPQLLPLSSKQGFLDLLRQDLDLLERYCCSPEALRQAATESGQPLLGDKWCELALLMERCRARLLQTPYRLRSTEMEELAGQLQALKEGHLPDYLAEELKRQLTQTHCYFWGFSELEWFSPQELAVIEALEGLGVELCLAICADDYLEDERMGAPLWARGRLRMKEVLKRFPGAKVERCAQALSAQNSYLEQAYPSAQSYLGEVSADSTRTFPLQIQVQQTSSIEESAEFLCAQIQRTCLANEARYKDFVVCLLTQDLDADFLYRCFESYGIPVYLDRRSSLAESALFRELLAFVRLVQSRFGQSEVLHYLRLATPVEQAGEVDAFEDFVLRHGLDRYRFHQRQAYRPIKAIEEQTKQAEAETLAQNAWAFYEKRLKPLYELAKTLQKKPSQLHFQALFLDYLEQTEAKQRVEQRLNEALRLGRADDSASEASAWKAFLAFLEDLVQLPSELPMDLALFRDLLQQAGQSQQVGRLPNLVDQVYVGSVEACLNLDRPHLILLGASAEGLGRPLPQSLLNELDRSELERYTGVALPREEKRLYEGVFQFYQLLTAPTLSLRYSVEAEARLPEGLQRLSEMASEVKTCSTPELKEELGHLHQARRRQALQRYLFREDLGEVEKAELGGQLPLLVQADLSYAQKLLQQSPRPQEVECLQLSDEERAGLMRLDSERPRSFSISRLESFAACPYRYWFSYVLGLRERERLRLDSRVGGTLSHLFLEDFFNAEQSLDEVEEKFNQLSEKGMFLGLYRELNRYVSEGRLPERFVEAGPFGASTRFVLLGLQKALGPMVQDLRESGFKPAELEASFDLSRLKGEALEAHIKRMGGEALFWNGIVDRLDLRTHEDGVAFRLIDYKTYDAKVDYDLIMAGLSLQLPAYLIGLQSIHPDWQAQNAYYYPVKRESGRLEGVQEGGRLEASSLVAKGKEELLPVLLQHSQKAIQSLYQSLKLGAFSPSPKCWKSDNACRYCKGKSACPLDQALYAQEPIVQKKKADWEKALKAELEEGVQ